MLVLIGFLLTVLFGLFLSLLIVPKMHPWGRLGLAYILGLGILTLFMFILLLLGINLTGEIILAFFIISNLAMVLFLRKSLRLFLKEFKSSLSISKFSSIEKGIFICIVLLNIYALFASLYLPVRDWDALTLYDFRGKILANPETQFDFMEGKLHIYYYSYPLLVSLSHSLIYIFRGENPLFLSGLFYIAFTSMFYGTLREVGTRGISLLATLLLISNVLLIQHTIAAYANLPYAVYFTMGTIYLYLWIIKGKKGYLFLSSILIALSTWTRDQEVFWLANLIILAIYGLSSKQFIKPIVYALVVIAVRSVWLNFKDSIFGPILLTSNQLGKSMIVLLHNLDLERMREVAIFLYKAISPNYYPIIILFLTLIVFNYKNIYKLKNFYILLFIFLNFIFLFIGTYIYSFVFPDWIKIPGSVERIFMFFPALFIFYIALVINSFEKRWFS